MSEHKASKKQEPMNAQEAPNVADEAEALRNPNWKWYVVNTYSGLENRAKKSLEERIQQYGLEEKFGEIFVPTETVEEMKGGVKKTQSRKTLPGYMLVEMELNDETVHLVRNTQKITGFVGGTKNPPPVRAAEIARMRTGAGAVQKPKSKVEFNDGDQVRVIEGPFANFTGNVEEVKADKQRLRVMVSIFGRSTPVELEYAQVEKIS